jgi:hypothetical protein
MPKSREGKRQLSVMVREELYLMLRKCAERSYRPLVYELEVAIVRHAAYPERISRPPLGELPAEGGPS